MKIWTYCIESEYSASPDVILFTDWDKLRERFIRDIIEDQRNMFDGGSDGPTTDELSDAVNSGSYDLDDLYDKAWMIYEAIMEDGAWGMPYYSFDPEPIELQDDQGQ